MAMMRSGVHLADASPAGFLEDRIGRDPGAGQGPADPLAGERLDIRGRIANPENEPSLRRRREAARERGRGGIPGGVEGVGEARGKHIRSRAEHRQNRVSRPSAAPHRLTVDRRGHVDPAILEADNPAVALPPHHHPQLAGGKIDTVSGKLRSNADQAALPGGARAVEDAKAAAAPEWEAPSVKDESAPVSGAGQKRKAPAAATKSGGAKSKAKKK